MANSESALQDISNLEISGKVERCDEFEDEMARFAAVVANIRFDRLSELATSIYMKRNREQAESANSTESKSAPTCQIVKPPLFGSYHILYVLEFDTEDRWVLKVPCIGYGEAWDKSAAEAMQSEAFTMRLLSRETTIPLPSVHHFDASLENDVGCPFILMDYVDGINGQYAWFDRSVDIDVLETRRARTLREVAKAMHQLRKFTFDQCGAPIYDRDGNYTSIGPMRIPDIDAALQSVRFEDETDDTGANDADDVDDLPVFCEIGPFTSAQECLLNPLEQRKPPGDSFSQGVYKLLPMLIEWLPATTRTPPFVLMHDDLDIQNIIVREDGSLAAIIDWDGIASAPRCIGNEKLPSWLTRDWDPSMYGYGKTCEDGEPISENSPTELARYRAMYARFMGECAGSEGPSRLTARSFLIDNLGIAASNQICTHGIVENVFDASIRARKWQRKNNGDDMEDEDEMYLYEFVTELEDGEFNQDQLSMLKEGFMALWSELDDLGGEFWSSIAEAAEAEARGAAKRREDQSEEASDSEAEEDDESEAEKDGKSEEAAEKNEAEEEIEAAAG